MVLLEVKDLTILSNNFPVPILNRIHIKIRSNRVTAIIGESGAGKTIFSMTISGLLPDSFNILSGEFFFDRKKIDYRWLQKNRKKTIFYIPQNAAASLNPVIKIRKQIMETAKSVEKKIDEIFTELSLQDSQRIMNSYPHELSGGECQRCILAMAILFSPRLLILDEPVTALDISVQEDFMKLLKHIQNELQLTVLVLSHNLKLIRDISDYVYVMRNGSIVDEGRLEGLILHPNHDYTRQITEYFYSSDKKFLDEFL